MIPLISEKNILELALCSSQDTLSHHYNNGLLFAFIDICLANKRISIFIHPEFGAQLLKNSWGNELLGSFTRNNILTISSEIEKDTIVILSTS